MLPNNGAHSSSLVVYPFIGPRNTLTTGIESWEIGGIALNNPSQGLLYQNWHAYADSQAAGNVYLKPDNAPASLLLTLPGITQLSITFDQNMAPFLAYTQNGIAKFYWYDTAIPGYTTTTLETGAFTPVASLDDKRPLASGNNDILLFYMVGTTCYYRMQRDRYNNIYTWDSSLGTHLISPSLVNVGMNTQNRFQVFLKAAFAT